MVIEVNNGTFKAMVDVTDAVAVVDYDADGNVIDTFSFGISESGSVTDKQFLANAKSDDGKLIFMREVNTTDADAVNKLKKLYGLALYRASRYEARAKQKLEDKAAAEAAEAAAIDALFA